MIFGRYGVGAEWFCGLNWSGVLSVAPLWIFLLARFGFIKNAGPGIFCGEFFQILTYDAIGKDVF